MSSETGGRLVRWFEDLHVDDVPLVGGKNASLGEMIATLKEQGIRVPDGFAVTSEAYWLFVQENDLKPKIEALLQDLSKGKKSLQKVGKAIRRLFSKASFSKELTKVIVDSYDQLSSKYNTKNLGVAVRSSATAEDLPEASFAGQQETFLNIRGEKALLGACRSCFASLFTDRAISYRIEKGFDHMHVALSVGVQKMIRSDLSGSGVLFTIDTETGFPNIVLINASWGLGENVVQGTVDPDEYTVFKPLLNKPVLHKKCFEPIIGKKLGSKAKKMVYARGGRKTIKNVSTSKQERESLVLSDDEILTLASWGSIIEEHYQKPMDIEWAKDGQTNDLFIVQARPETVQSQKKASILKTYSLSEKGKKITEGSAVGQAVSAGKAQIIKSVKQIDEFEDNAILITPMTDPDWVPIMKRASGIITDHGGRTSHAAIVSRELGIPAIVGTGNATRVIKNHQEITLSCAEGDQGYVYDGILKFEETMIHIDDLPKIDTKIMINLATPTAAFRWWKLPCHGVGLARMEFIINDDIKIHPMALVRFDELKDSKVKRVIQELSKDYDDKTEYFVDKLAQGIGRIAASQYPKDVIVRLSDFKTNEYANLIGGAQFEPHEENPMLGFRGASRYYSPRYREGFALECRALKAVREQMGLHNVVVMVPFCRTVDEADHVLEVMAENGLRRGEEGLRVYVMAEIPSNVIEADHFAERFDGFSIGSNDLTQLVLGVDRDSEDLAHIFDARNESVKRMIKQLIETAHKYHCKVGICGQAPSDYPEFAEFLVRCNIDSLSLNPDSIISVIRHIAEIEKRV